MRTLRATSSENEAIHALAVMPTAEDCNALDRMLPGRNWKLHKTRAVASALERLRRPNRISLVLCERDLRPGSWRELLDEVRRLDNPPLLIVASRFADEPLWAEALNLGAYDVLAKPFDADEVSRTLTSAWRRWWNVRQPPRPASDGIGYASGMPST